MAVKKTVAAPRNDSFEASIPETASTAGELEATPDVTAQTEGAQMGLSDSEAVQQSKLAALAKARAAKAAKKASKAAAFEKEANMEAQIEAKILARQKAAESISSIQTALAAEKANDHLSFGDIREVARVMPTKEEYVKVEIPLADLFDHSHPGVQLNRHRFEPGRTYLLRGDVALEVKKRLAMFHDEQVRLLRPNADRKALNDVNRGSQWTSRGGNSVVPMGRLEDVPTASDERIYTVDF